MFLLVLNSETFSLSDVPIRKYKCYGVKYASVVFAIHFYYNKLQQHFIYKTTKRKNEAQPKKEP